jgi:hypothetical protein
MCNVLKLNELDKDFKIRRIILFLLKNLMKIISMYYSFFIKEFDENNFN